jgi:hypothetical protein
MSAAIERPADVPPETWGLFVAYHRSNPELWKAFERFALEAANRGKRIGAKAIMERVRWEAEIERGDEFKVCNSYTAYYARIFAAKHPRFSELFEFRNIKGIAA